MKTITNFKSFFLIAILLSLIDAPNAQTQESYFFEYRFVNKSSPIPTVIKEYHEWNNGHQLTLFTEINSTEQFTITERDERGLPTGFSADLSNRLEDDLFPAYRNTEENYIVRTVVDPAGVFTQPETEILFEDLYEFDWNLTGEQKYIDSLLCLRATTEFRCLEFEVWYSPDIPISSGPFILHGLPGLIVKASYYDGDNVFKLEHFGKLDKPRLNMKMVGFDLLNFEELPNHCDLKEGYERYVSIIKAKFGGPDCTNCDKIINSISWGECFDECD